MEVCHKIGLTNKVVMLRFENQCIIKEKGKYLNSINKKARYFHENVPVMKFLYQDLKLNAKYEAAILCMQYASIDNCKKSMTRFHKK